MFANGNQYEGEFLNSKKHGKGIFKFGNLNFSNQVKKSSVF